MRFWRILDGRREKRPFLPAVVTILGEKQQEGKAADVSIQPRTPPAVLDDGIRVERSSEQHMRRDSFFGRKTGSETGTSGGIMRGVLGKLAAASAASAELALELLEKYSFRLRKYFKNK